MKFRHGLVAAIIGLGVVAAATAGTANAAGPASHALVGSGFTAVTPTRILDTRIGIGSPAIRMGTNETRTFGLPSWVPVNATAVALNLTGINYSTSLSTYLTAWGDGLPKPDTSAVNVDGWENDGTFSNLTTVSLTTNRDIALYNHDGSVDAVADVVGYYTPGTGSGYTALTPATRVLDTRNGIGAPFGGLGPDSTVTLDLSSYVPAGTTAVTLNLTATNSLANTYITVYPDGVPRPVASNMNPGFFDQANLVTVAVSPDRKIDIYNHVGIIDLIGDLAGYYAPNTGSGYVAVPSHRVLDTRTGLGGSFMFGPGAIRSLDLSGSLPTGTTSVLLNMTGVDALNQTYITLWPNGAQQPVTSNLNVVPWDTMANLASVAVPANRTVNVYNNAGNTDLLADLDGYFVSGS